MFQLLFSHLQACFVNCHKMLCTHSDPIVFTFMECQGGGRGVRDFELRVLWNNALFETLLIEINVSTESLDLCSQVII